MMNPISQYINDDDTLIPGLPQHLADTHVFPRLTWRDIGSALGVNKAWRSTLLAANRRHQDILDLQHKSGHDQVAVLAVIHPAPKYQQQDGGYSYYSCPSQASHQGFCTASANARDNSSTSYFAISLYDEELNSWEQLPPLPGLDFGVPLGARCICVEGQLYVLGGRNPLTWDFMAEVFAMDLRATSTSQKKSRCWRSCTQMNTPRSGFACVAIGGKIIVAGGQGEGRLCLASVEVYDVMVQRWEQIPHLNTPRNECTGALIDNTVCIIGGYSSLDESDDEWCDLESDDQIKTFWVSSADCIQLGCQKWQTATGRSINKKLKQAYNACNRVSLSGALSFVHCSRVQELWERCEDDWNVIEGKIMKRCTHGAGVATSIFMSSILHGLLAFGSRCHSHEGSRRVCVSLCKLKAHHPIDTSADQNQTDFQEIWCPFELNVMPLPICLVKI